MFFLGYIVRWGGSFFSSWWCCMVSAKAKDHLDLHVANALVLCASVLMQAGFVWGPVGISILEWISPSGKVAIFAPRHRNAQKSKSHGLTPCFGVVFGLQGRRHLSKVEIVSPSADIRRHVTACKAAVFLGRRHSQTQRQVIPKHFGLVRRHPQTSAQRGSNVRRHPQTSADTCRQRMFRGSHDMQRYYSASLRNP